MVTTTVIKLHCSVRSLNTKDANTIKRAHEDDDPAKILCQVFEFGYRAFFILCSHRLSKLYEERCLSDLSPHLNWIFLAMADSTMLTRGDHLL